MAPQNASSSRAQPRVIPPRDPQTSKHGYISNRENSVQTTFQLVLQQKTVSPHPHLISSPPVFPTLLYKSWANSHPSSPPKALQRLVFCNGGVTQGDSATDKGQVLPTLHAVPSRPKQREPDCSPAVLRDYRSLLNSWSA